MGVEIYSEILKVKSKKTVVYYSSTTAMVRDYNLFRQEALKAQNPKQLDLRWC